MGGSWLVAFAAVFSLMYLAARTWFSEAESIWSSPFKAVGGAGIAAGTPGLVNVKS